MLVSWRVKRGPMDSRTLRIGVFLGVTAVFCSAPGVVLLKTILEKHEFLWVVIVRLIGGFGVMLLIASFRRQWPQIMANFRKPHPWLMTTTGCFLGGYVAMLLWLAGYKLIDASVASILNETNVVFILILAWLFLGEKITSRKLWGIGLTAAGVLIMVIK